MDIIENSNIILDNKLCKFKQKLKNMSSEINDEFDSLSKFIHEIISEKHYPNENKHEANENLFEEVSDYYGEKCIWTDKKEEAVNKQKEIYNESFCEYSACECPLH